MSGPPYPHPNPRPGSNAIGQFQIGVSPIGTIAAFDVWTTIINQYANSAIITALCVDMNAYVDPTANFDEFYDTIWNIDTAIGRGLDIWGRILNVARVLAIPASDAFFGFEEPGTPDLLTGFGQAPFFSGQQITSNFSLSDDAYRVLLIAKALSNISDGSIPAINQILINLFGLSGKCYVTDGLNMTMTYTFAFVLTPVQNAIVQNSGVLPRPSGVSLTIVVP